MMNRFFTLLFAASCLTAVGQVPDYVPTDELVGWWPLDGSSNSEELFDYTIVGEVTFGEDRYGSSSSSLAFNSTDSSYVDLGIPFPSGNATKSFALWIKPEVDQYQWFISGGTSDDGLAFGLFMDPNASNSLSFHGNGIISDLRFSDIPIGVWCHIAITFSGDYVAAYFNGEFVEDKLVDLATTSNSIWLGARNNNTAFLSGQIDDVGIWSRVLTEEDILGLYLAEDFGCTDQTACNYHEQATVDNGTCHFLCEYCIDGTIWNEELQGCIHGQSADINNDGCVQLNDLLDLLSAYGDCGAEESAWQCGEPLEYQGYDYATVLIGEQCWFAENLRAENYRNGDPIPSGFNNTLWEFVVDDATSTYGSDIGQCSHSQPGFDPCADAETSLAVYGRLYNFGAAINSRGLCPNGWHVSTDTDWFELELLFGMDEGSLQQTGYRGDIAPQLRAASDLWLNPFNNNESNNSSGLSFLPGGSRNNLGMFINAGDAGYCWAPNVSEEAYRRYINYGNDGVSRDLNDHRAGMSIRCIKDTE